MKGAVAWSVSLLISYPLMRLLHESAHAVTALVLGIPIARIEFGYGWALTVPFPSIEKADPSSLIMIRMAPYLLFILLGFVSLLNAKPFAARIAVFLLAINNGPLFYMLDWIKVAEGLSSTESAILFWFIMSVSVLLILANLSLVNKLERKGFKRTSPSLGH